MANKASKNRNRSSVYDEMIAQVMVAGIYTINREQWKSKNYNESSFRRMFNRRAGIEYSCKFLVIGNTIEIRRLAREAHHE